MARDIVHEWLCSIGLAQYYQSFFDNGYDELEICKAIGLTDLEAIGVRCAEHQRILLSSVKTMREEGATSIYFTLEPSAGKYAEKCAPPHVATASSDTDKYAEGKSALAHGDAACAAGSADLSRAAAGAEKCLNVASTTADYPATRREATSSELSSSYAATPSAQQQRPRASPSHSCSHKDHRGVQRDQPVGSGAPDVRAIEHTCGRAGSVKVVGPTSSQGAAYQPQAAAQRCTHHSWSAPVTPAHAALPHRGACAADHGWQNASHIMTHEERMKVVCEMTQGQLSIGEAMALLSHKRKPADDTSVMQKKPAEKRGSNFLKLLSFRKNKKSQERSGEKKTSKQQPCNDGRNVPAEIQHKSSLRVSAPQTSNGSVQRTEEAVGTRQIPCTHCACSKRSCPSPATTDVLAQSCMPSSRHLSCDITTESTSSGSVSSVSGLSSKWHSHDESSQAMLQSYHHSTHFYSPQVSRRRVDPCAHQWDEDDSVWLPPTRPPGQQKPLVSRSPTADFGRERHQVECADLRKRDSGCYGSGECLHGGQACCKLSTSSGSSSVSSRDSTTRPDQRGCADGVGMTAARPEGSVNSLAPSKHHSAPAGARAPGSVQLTQLFRGLDLDMALRLQQSGISLHESPYTTADGRWSVPPAVVINLAKEINIPPQEACSIIDRIRVKLLAASGRAAVALEMSFQGPSVGRYPLTVDDFLLKAGLPGYAGLFSLHGYDTVARVAAMTEADVRRCGVSDCVHIQMLLSHADRLSKPAGHGNLVLNDRL